MIVKVLCSPYREMIPKTWETVMFCGGKRRINFQLWLTRETTDSRGLGNNKACSSLGQL